MARILNAPAALLALAVIVLAAGCGKTGGGPADAPTAATAARPSAGSDQPAAAQLGFPLVATKNTTRVAGADAVADAAGVAEAVFPSTDATTRPSAVVIADAGDWRAAIAASVFMARPVRAPLLLSDGGELPEATSAALARLAPGGSAALGGVQAIRVGAAPAPGGLRSTAVTGDDPFTLAAAIDRLASSAAGRPSDSVLVVGAGDPAYAMPAAAWAAKSGDPVLYVQRDGVPAATVAALRRHDHPRVYVLGTPAQVSPATVARLRRLGTVRRVTASTPQRAAVAFARFSQGAFGWGVVQPGHGLVFANPTQPASAAAAAPLSSSGTYGPLLLTDRRGGLPPAVVQLLLDIQPGYRSDPVLGVYNHGWLIGDERLVGAGTQSRIDTLLEISPVSEQPSP